MIKLHGMFTNHQKGQYICDTTIKTALSGAHHAQRQRRQHVVVICLERGADLHVAQMMSLPLTDSCFSKIHIGLTFLVPAHLGSPGQRAIKQVSLFHCLFLLGFVTSTIYLPTEWHHPCVRTRLERDRVVDFK